MLLRSDEMGTFIKGDFGLCGGKYRVHLLAVHTDGCDTYMYAQLVHSMKDVV